MDEALKEKAKALAQAVKESDVFRAWQQARAELEQRAAAQIMLRDLQRAQAEIMRKVRASQPVGQKRRSGTAARWEVAYNRTAAVLQAEQALGQLLASQRGHRQELGLGRPRAKAPDGGPRCHRCGRSGAGSGRTSAGLWFPGGRKTG